MVFMEPAVYLGRLAGRNGIFDIFEISEMNIFIVTLDPGLPFPFVLVPHNTNMPRSVVASEASVFLILS